MRSLPVVAGALVLGFALVLSVSTFRRTFTHVHRSSLGESEFAIDLPRGWVATNVPGVNFESVRGPLPSGRSGVFYLQSHRFPEDAGSHPDIPWVDRAQDDAIREVRFEGAWRRCLSRRLGAPARDGSRRVESVVGRIDRGRLACTALGSGLNYGLTDEDLETLASCAASIRWVGR